MSKVAQRGSKLGQRIGHWICNTEVIHDPDNGSSGSDGAVGGKRIGGENKDSKYRKFNCMKAGKVVAVGRECRVSFKKGGTKALEVKENGLDTDSSGRSSYSHCNQWGVRIRNRCM